MVWCVVEVWGHDISSPEGKIGFHNQADSRILKNKITMRAFLKSQFQGSKKPNPIMTATKSFIN